MQSINLIMQGKNCLAINYDGLLHTSFPFMTIKSISHFIPFKKYAVKGEKISLRFLGDSNLLIDIFLLNVFL